MLWNLLVDGYIDFGLDKTQWANHQQMTWHLKFSQTVETSHWTSKSNLTFCASALFFYSLWPWFPMKWYIYFETLSICPVPFLLSPDKNLRHCIWFRSGFDIRNVLVEVPFLNISVGGGWWCNDTRLRYSLWNSYKFLNQLSLTVHSRLQPSLFLFLLCFSVLVSSPLTCLNPLFSNDLLLLWDSRLSSG